jgi:hypothetical protein
MATGNANAAGDGSCTQATKWPPKVKPSPLTLARRLGDHRRCVAAGSAWGTVPGGVLYYWSPLSSSAMCVCGWQRPVKCRPGRDWLHAGGADAAMAALRTITDRQEETVDRVCPKAGRQAFPFLASLDSLSIGLELSTSSYYWGD